MPLQTWTHEHFDQLSWHDSHVHAWAIAESQHGQATLTLDIDFITAWEQPGDGAFAFRVAPATLTFFDIFGLTFEVDYTGFAVSAFSIQGIERELRVNEAGYRDYLYTIEINYPRGCIKFSGERFQQTLRAAPLYSRSQSLDASNRKPLIGGAQHGAAADDRPQAGDRG